VPAPAVAGLPDGQGNFSHFSSLITLVIYHNHQPL